MSKLDPREKRERTVPVLHTKDSYEDLRDVEDYSIDKLREVFKRYSSINLSDIKKIAKKEFDKPVISMFLTLTGENTLREDKVFLSEFNSLMRTELEEKKHYIDSISKEDQLTFRQDIKEIQYLLMNITNFFNEKMKSLVIFKSGSDFGLAINLLKPLPTQNLFVVKDHPYTLPLMAMFDEETKILLVEVGKDETIFHEYHLSRMKVLDKINFPFGYKRVNVKAERSAGKGQDYFKNQLDNYYKDIVDKVEEYLRGKYEAFVLVGDNAVLKVLGNFISNNLREKLLGKLQLDPGQSVKGQRELISELISEKESIRIKSDLEDIEEALGQERAVKGIDAVIKTQNRFLTTDLYVDPSYIVSGYKCPEHDYLSVTAKRCPLCQKQLTKVRNLVNAVTEIGQKFGAKIHLLSSEDNILEEHENIVAIVYESVEDVNQILS